MEVDIIMEVDQVVVDHEAWDQALGPAVAALALLRSSYARRSSWYDLRLGRSIIHRLHRLSSWLWANHRRRRTQA